MIFVDLDEVFSDFTGAALKAHGISREEFEALRTAKGGHWDLEVALGISATQFWRPIHAMGEQFWVELEPLPWADTLFDLLNRSGNEWFVVTSPSMHPGCYTGKVKWVHDQFGFDVLTRTLITKYKHLFARQNHYLIDDRPSNIWKFEEAGGNGILFPNQGNVLREYTSDPVKYLESVLIQKGLLK